MKTIIIFGGTGSWGQELTSQLINREDVKEIRIFSRGELSQVEMQRKFNNCKLKFITGDIRDEKAVLKAMEGVDEAYHLAALKHVIRCQDQPNECIKTNILGSQNIIEAASAWNINKCILVSTDKACSPTNTYGASKFIAENMFINANVGKIKFAVVRAGNVVGSNGSIIPVFIEKAKNELPLPITNYQMTRYFMTIPEAIELVRKASDSCLGGEIFVTKMPAANMLDIAATIWEYYNGEEYDITENFLEYYFPEIGIISGEKLHESLVSEHEALHTVEDYHYRIILPMNGSLNSKYKEFTKMTEPYYISNQKLMNQKEIQELLMRAEVLK